MFHCFLAVFRRIGEYIPDLDLLYFVSLTGCCSLIQISLQAITKTIGLANSEVQTNLLTLQLNVVEHCCPIYRPKP